MNRILRAGFALLTVGLAIVAAPLPARALDDLFFLHHSTGRNLLVQGEVRELISDHNASQGTSFVLWDHDYNYLGLTDLFGIATERCYDIPNDNTDPVGLHELWTTANSARDSILANHQVIAFKSCYPASDIVSDAMLAQYKTWYLAIRDELDRHPNHIFLVLSPPPLHPCHTTVAAADRARAFADWLGSPTFLYGHPNLNCFDLFNALAEPRDSLARNTLRVAYCNTLVCQYADSHPNNAANLAVAPLFVDALLDAAGRIDPPAVYLAQFRAERRGPQAMVHWAISQPRAHVGFHLWRQEPGRERIRLNHTLLGGQEVYDFVDLAPPTGAAEYWLQEVTTDGLENWYGPAHLAAAALPSALALHQNAPNPFNPSTTIRFDLPAAGSVRLAVYDVAGRRIRTLVDGDLALGSHEAVWDGRDSAGRGMASGSYLARLEAGGKVETVRMKLVR